MKTPNPTEAAHAVIDSKYPPIGDYGLIGDCRGAGLVSRDGSLDWLCLPRFDSPAIFAALLDKEGGGRFRIRPTGPFRTERRYRPDTNILETTFHGAHGVVVLRDLMPVASEADKRTTLLPEQQVLREIEGLSGEVELEILYDPRPDFGRLRPALERRGALGLWCQAGSAALVLHGDLPRDLVVGSGARGTMCIRADERRYLSLVYTTEAPAVLPALGEHARASLERSATWWRDWAARCTYQGPYREAVVRSALALKLLAYAPSGAIVAAPTTSLPEEIGGVRNWDYRYCWLRDASFTLRALYALGYAEEARAFIQWILHATRQTWPRLQILYDVFGRVRVPERTLPHLDGYAGSRPVRVGNGASAQVQLDVYGEVIDAVARFAEHDGRFDRDAVRFLDGLGNYVCNHWRDPDDGVWEGRSGPQQHTHAKALCWVALDRLIMLHERHGLSMAAPRFRAERDAIRAVVEERGYNARLGSYTRLLDGDDVDASLLLLALYGYAAGTDPRMDATCTRVHEQLAHDDLVYRYLPGTDDGLPGGEGAFGIACFWAVECRFTGGDLAGAKRAFEHLLTFGSDLGLFAEEIDPATGAALGNFPQAFTHIGLINAALTLTGTMSDRTPAATSVSSPAKEER